MPVPPLAPRCQPETCTIALTGEFKKMKPPEFHGGIEPLKAEAWVLGIEKLFKVFPCTKTQKVQLAAFTLEDDARRWWMDKRAAKFMELKQGNKSIAEYEVQFTKLACFALNMVDTDYKKARQFEGGLCDPILDKVNVLKLPTYVDVLNRALIAERNVANRKQNFEWKGRK
ncbi:uncharacterized protein LOC114259013 [Camellia sinensis]|uniref:uncharacterized protein LOC114259013 n=1 Tax=Camellia sinensis TaxID=4442 RepID=UPI0010357CC3|nr:uncharacterized protein LOC114259013 [Camellia sinensis]